jgi:hypothetical protein
MKVPERAAQIWPVLAFAAGNRQVVTYEILGRLIGVPSIALGQLLEPIQSYCLMKQLPPLTILVVSKRNGLPGSGFTAASDIPMQQIRVFEHDWQEVGCPTPEEFDSAVKAVPSKKSDSVSSRAH